MVSESMAHAHHDAMHEEQHATNEIYIRVAIILAIITAIEVFIYYLPSARPLLVPALILLSLAKFLLVVGYFMHLKYDSPLFRFMFFAGLILTLGVFLAMIAMFVTAETYFPIVQPLLGG
jgi:cytochrome c oxidase subunit IV